MAFRHNNKIDDHEPAWGEIDKTELPRIAFADMGEEGKKSTWKYPHHWVKGGTRKDENGVWLDGELYLHRGGLIAAWAAAHGARSGQIADDEVIAHLRAHRKALGMDEEDNEEAILVGMESIDQISGPQQELNKDALSLFSRGFWCIDSNAMLSALNSGLLPFTSSDSRNVIEIKGILTFDGTPWTTSYTQIREKIKRLVASGYKDILLSFDSPGGDVSGLFGLIDFIRNDVKSRGIKITAVINEHAYSAAYALASTADRIVMAKTGGVGSIGVIAAHADISKMDEMAGIKWTFVSAGKYKDLLNPHRAVDEDDIAYLKGRVDSLYSMLIDVISQNRGLSRDVIMQYGARLFHGDEAVQTGLVDELVDDVVGYIDSLTSNYVKQTMIAASDVAELISCVLQNKDSVDPDLVSRIVLDWRGLEHTMKAIYEQTTKSEVVIRSHVSANVVAQNILLEDAKKRRR